MCVCEIETERERERETKRFRETERQRESETESSCRVLKWEKGGKCLCIVCASVGMSEGVCL